VLIDALVGPTEEGAPQGGPLSPLFSNPMLDVLDKELRSAVITLCAMPIIERMMTSNELFLTRHASHRSGRLRAGL
jgi:retron-type reverse transcriptase